VGASAEERGGGLAPTSGFAEAADQAVNLPAIGVVLAAGAATLLLGQRWWDPMADAQVTVPVFYALAVVGAALCGFLLHVRSRLLEDVRARWVAAGFAVAAVVGAVQGLAVLELWRAPVVVSADGITLLFLLGHAALSLFVLAGRYLRDHRRGRRAAVAAFGGAILLAVALPDTLLAGVLVDASGRFTAAYGVSLLALILVTVLALAVWSRDAGREPTRPQVWVAVCLVLALLDLLLSLRAERLFEAIWWSSAALRSLQFAIPAVGLLADSARLSTLLHRHERGLVAKLAEELRLAAEEAHRAEEGRTARATQPASDAAAADRVRKVLEDASFHPVYQPIYSLETGRLVTIEALTRFRAEPVRPPDVWFAEAHEVGLGSALELAALRAALEGSGPLPDGVDLAVNLSPGVLVDPRTRAELRRWGNERRLVVEITEHAAVDDYPRLTAVLHELRTAGVRVAVDDAGAGFASLRHVVRLAPDILKLDRALTRDVHVDPVQRSLATCLAAFARQTDTMLVAEGVEHPDELAIWQELGADAAQGYLLGRPGPLPAAAVAPLLTLRVPRRRRALRREGLTSRV
jgi:EAL domain-containing protein (putative c-di-GMP-specific phosphodiesterase class I)